MKFPPLCQISLKSVNSSEVIRSSGTDVADKTTMMRQNKYESLRKETQI